MELLGIFTIFVSVLFVVDASSGNCSAGKESGIMQKLVGKLSVNIDFIDEKNKSVVAVRYIQNDSSKTSSALYHHKGDKDVIYLISSERIAVIDEGQCTVEDKKTAKSSPLVLAPFYDGTDAPVFALADLFAKLSALSFTLETSDDNATYSTCIDKNNMWITYSIVLNRGLSYSDLLNEGKPRDIRIEVENATTKDVKYKYTLRLSQYSDSLNAARMEEMLLPPVGISCGSFNEDKSKILPNFPDRFSVKSDYIDYGQNFIVYNKIMMDENLVSYGYSKILTNQPLTQKPPMANLPDEVYTVVHDFNTGLQYVTLSGNDSCYNVSGIPISSADVESNSAKVIRMKNARDILIGGENLTFSYVGQRMIDGLPADVHSAESTDKNFTFELWIYNKTGAHPQNYVVILSRTYQQVNSTPVLLSQETLYDMELAPKNGFWRQINVKDCMPLVQNYSYLLITLATKDAASVNYAELEFKLRTKLAEMANVSVLRVANFYFQPVNKTDIFAFFQLADRVSANGTETVRFKPEIDVEEAYNTLNRSLEHGDLKIDIQGVEVRATKNALNFVPPYFSAFNSTVNVIEQKRGYSGGSMAALAFFMMVIGGVSGFGLAFFLWKRNRGIQYQIYE